MCFTVVVVVVVVVVVACDGVTAESTGASSQQTSPRVPIWGAATRRIYLA